MNSPMFGAEYYFNLYFLFQKMMNKSFCLFVVLLVIALATFVECNPQFGGGFGREGGFGRGRGFGGRGFGGRGFGGGFGGFGGGFGGLGGGFGGLFGR